MYTITFYSFKGGVGRTLALVNVAAELAKMGRKVLLVDFDLEAPGLETYKPLRPPKPHPGIVEYVTEYRRTMNGPDVREYIYEAAPVGKKGGRLWVMPAGRRDANYQKALVNIDWKKLYAEEEGFLLFEDAKAQWEQDYKADYVFIDSRTGHTDVEGICTRQLADSVVLMFMPNEQNLAGLEGVARAIRSEATEGLQKSIRLHFVASNVPNLDDEERVLHGQMRAFRERLEFKKISGVIRRYESMSLLNQSVFTLDRSHTRLAHSYRRLLRALITDNPADRDGTLMFLRGYALHHLPKNVSDISGAVMRKLGASEPPWYPGWDPCRTSEVDAADVDDKLNRIAEFFQNDADILVKVAECRTLEGNSPQAAALLNLALKAKPDHPEALLHRALGKNERGDKDGAAADLLECLRAPNIETADPALRALIRIEPKRLAEAVELPGVEDLDAIEVSELLADAPGGLPLAIQLMRRYLANFSPKERNPVILHTYLIRAGKWREVIDALEKKDLTALGAGDLFELAIASWGETGVLRADLCRLALEKRGTQGRSLFDRHYGADWLLLWGAGRGSEVLPLLDTAEKEVKQGRRRPFSIWRLQEVSPEKFVEDCEQFRRMIQGEPIRPAFLGDSPASLAP